MNRRTIELAAVLLAGAVPTGCSASEGPVGPEPWQPGEVASTEQLRNRINNLIDLQGKRCIRCPRRRPSG